MSEILITSFEKLTHHMTADRGLYLGLLLSSVAATLYLMKIKVEESRLLSAFEWLRIVFIGFLWICTLDYIVLVLINLMKW